MHKTKSLFDVIGPVIIGPSSSHTAGAVRLGLVAGRIFGEKPQKVKFVLYNSFAKTGKGHGTDKGILGGVLGFNVDDERIKESFEIADKEGICHEFEFREDSNRHPNTVEIILENENLHLKISGYSVGAGEILINKINDYSFNINGDYNTLVLIYKDKPGMVYRVSALIQGQNVNIATMHCDRNAKGERASMGVALDAPLPDYVINELSKIDEMYLIRNVAAIES